LEKNALGTLEWFWEALSAFGDNGVQVENDNDCSFVIGSLFWLYIG